MSIVPPPESVTARRGSDYAAALEGSAVRVLGTVSSRPVSFASFSHLAIQDETGHGLFLEGQPAQFARLQPGDRVEVSGTVSRRAGLPVLLPANIRLVSRGAAPAPLPVSIVAGIFAAAVVLALVMDQVKVWLFGYLKMV